MSAPRNTSAEMRESAAVGMAFIAGAIAGGPDGFSRAIEDQEASGSAQLRASTVLPVDGSEDPTFVELGITFGAQTPGDPLFREATIPDGWSKQPGEESRTTYLVDQRGVRRVCIFYKAAFYDRHAHMHVMDVGESISSEWIYGRDEELALSAGLTEDELASAHDHAREYLDMAVEHPHIYGDRKPRAIEIYQATRVELEKRKGVQRTRKRTGR